MDSFSKCVFVRAGKHTSVHDMHPHSNDNMRDWISKHKINIINFKRLSHDDAKYNSSRLIVSVSDYVSLCKPNQWRVVISPNITH